MSQPGKHQKPQDPSHTKFRSHAERPWIRANASSNEENDKAKAAYKALKTISLRRSDLPDYKNFEARVKERAETKYNYSATTGKEYEVRGVFNMAYNEVYHDRP